MAFCYLVLALRIDPRAAVDLKNQVTTSALGNNGDAYAQRFVKMVQNELKACAGGVRQGNLYGTILDSAAALPTGNIACTQANAAGNFVRFTYGGALITLTEGVDFARGASDTTCAANLAAAINAHAVLGKAFTALGAAGNCGLTGKVPTTLLQNYVLSTDDGTAFALTQLTGGGAGAAQFALQHFALNRTP